MGWESAPALRSRPVPGFGLFRRHARLSRMLDGQVRRNFRLFARRDQALPLAEIFRAGHPENGKSATKFAEKFGKQIAPAGHHEPV